MTTTGDILFARRGSAGLVTLNRPKALNAITHDMVRALAAQLDAWAKDDAVTRVIVTANGERAFSAGGDIRALYDLITAGKLRLLAVATAKPMASLPNVPTVAQTLPGFESVAWYAVVAPPKTPKAITEKINADINEALRDPEIQEKLKKLSAEVVGGSTEQTAKYLREEVARWKKVITDANVTIGG